MNLPKISGLEYNQWLAELKDKIRTRQLNAVLKVNTEMIALYWDLGKAITEKVENSNWGEKIISQLAVDLRVEFRANNGLSRSNLFYFCKFYRFYADYSKLVQQPLAQPYYDSVSFYKKTYEDAQGAKINVWKMNKQMKEIEGKKNNYFNSIHNLFEHVYTNKMPFNYRYALLPLRFKLQPKINFEEVEIKKENTQKVITDFGVTYM